MRMTRWLALAGMVAVCGLIAAGCGDDEDESSSTAAAPASTEETTAAESTGGESTSEETTGDSVGVDADGVYEACADAVSGSAAEEQALAACEQARAAFESCASQSDSLDSPAREDAIEICREAAEQVISAAKAGAGVGGY